MKSSELKDKSVEELGELLKQNSGELFQSRLQNFTNQLDDTSSVPKRRHDVARIKTELLELAASVKAAVQAHVEGNE